MNRRSRLKSGRGSGYLPHHLRIGMFSESFDPVQNGVTTSLLTLTAGMRSRKHNVFIFAPAHQQQPASESNVLRFPSFVSLFNKDYPLAYPFLPRLAIAAHFDTLRLDLVHTHTPFVLGLTGQRLAIQRRMPLVSTFHTLYTRYSHYMPILPESMTQSLIERYLPWYYNRCSEIICPSVTAEMELRNLGVIRPIQVIPSGIPFPPAEMVGDLARTAARSYFALPPTAPLMLYAGRIAREKRLDWLLDAFAIVKRQVPDACLAIAGDGPFVDELRAQADALSLTSSLYLLGPQPRSQMDSLYASADVFCFPSPSETQGLVIGEARAAGTPCVVMDGGGAPETVSNHEDGVRVECGNVRNFADAMLSILLSPAKAAAMREAARSNALRFTPDAMVSKVLSVYERAARLPLPEAIIERNDPVEMDLAVVAEGLAEVSAK